MNYQFPSKQARAGAYLNGRALRVPLVDRLWELKSALLARGLGVPESPVNPGAPNVELVAALIDSTPASFGNSRGTPLPARVTLYEMVEELGLCSSSEVKAAVEAEPIQIRSQTLDLTMKALLDWAEQLRCSGGRVPCKGNLPCFGLIAQMADVQASKLANAALPYRHFLIELGFEVGTTDHLEVRAKLNAENVLEGRLSARAQRLSDHLSKTYVQVDIPLPESSRRLGYPPYQAICSAAGVKWTAFGKGNELQQIIDRAAILVGIGVDRFRQEASKDLPTYGELLVLGSQWFALESAENSDQGGARLRWALRHLLRQWGTTETERLHPHFDERCSEDMGTIANAIENRDTRRHWLGEIQRWRRYIGRISAAASNELPETLGGALKALLRKSKYIDIADLCRTAGVTEHCHAVRGWIQLGRNPVATDKAVVVKLEQALGVEPGLLTSRIRRVVRPTRGHIRNEFWPESLDTEVLRRCARPLLPHDFAYLPDDQREEIGRQIRLEYEGQIEFRSKMRSVTAWRLHPLPPILAQEIGELVEYKTSSVPEFPRTRKWKEGTVDRSTETLREFFSAMALSRGEGGLGVAADELTLAHLACPQVVRWYAKWLSKRYPERLTIGARVNLGVLASLTTPESKGRKGRGKKIKGYLHYATELRKRLKPIEGVVSEEDVANMQTEEGWHSALSRANSQIWQIFLSQDENFGTSRDPFEPILRILEMPRPMDALITMLELAGEDLPDRRTSTPLMRAVAMRSLVLALIVVRTGLRRSNLGALTYRADNRGKLTSEGGIWKIEITASEFKNMDSSFFGNRSANYVCYMEPGDSIIIDEYISVSRKLLAPNSDWLFVSKTGARRTDDLLYQDMMELTWRYLVYHESTGTGIPGVERFGLHAVRDIIATHILKVTGDVGLAADALQDTQEMIMKHYAHYLPDDRTKRVRKFFASDLSRLDFKPQN